MGLKMYLLNQHSVIGFYTAFSVVLFYDDDKISLLPQKDKKFPLLSKISGLASSF